MAEAYAYARRDELALLFLRRARQLKSEVGDRWGLAYVHRVMAQIFLNRGDIAGARQEVSAGTTLADQLGDPKIAAMLRVMLGRILLGSGEVDASEHAFEAAMGSDPEGIEALRGLGVVDLMRGRAARAAERASAARTRAARLGIQRLQAEALLTEGRATAKEAPLLKALRIAAALDDSLLRDAILTELERRRS
jgi:hypothetical protein